MTQLLLYRLYMIQKLVFLKILSCSCGPDDFLGFTLRLYFSVCVLSICAQDILGANKETKKEMGCWYTLYTIQMDPKYS